jgi:hypothetical protein
MYITRTIYGAAAAISMALMPSMSAHASPQPLENNTRAHNRAVISDAQFYSIVKAGAKAGVYTLAQRAAITSRPDLASITADPTATPTVSAVKARAPHEISRSKSAAAGTRRVDRYVHVPAFLRVGNGFNFHLVARWSYSGGRITGTPHAEAYLSGTSEYPGVKIKSLDINRRWTRQDHHSNEMVLTGRWEQCVVRFGCIAGAGVRGQYGLYGNGNYTWFGFRIE